MKDHDKNTELRVIGALIICGSMKDEGAVSIFSQVTEDFFMSKDVKELFGAIKSQVLKDLPFDAISLSPIISEVAYQLLLPILDGDYHSFSTISNDIEVLKKMHRLRPKLELIKGANRALLAEINQDVALELIQELGSKLITDRPLAKEYAQECEELIEEILTSDENPTEIKTNLRDWPPFPATGMIVVAGRAGIGKTMMGLHLLEKILEAKPGTKAIYFNLEMSKRVMVNRYLNMIYPFTGSLKSALNMGGATELLKRNLLLITKPNVTISEIELISTCQSLEHDISVIVVDYVGRVKGLGSNRHEQLEEIAQDLAGLAIKLDCVVLAIQQVSKEKVEKVKVDRVPQIHEGAGSMGFERAAEWWLGIDQPQVAEPENPSVKDLFIVKNRKSRGDSGYFTAYLTFKGGRFYEVDQRECEIKMNNQGFNLTPLSKFKKEKNYCKE